MRGNDLVGFCYRSCGSILRYFRRYLGAFPKTLNLQTLTPKPQNPKALNLKPRQNNGQKPLHIAIILHIFGGSGKYTLHSYMDPFCQGFCVPEQREPERLDLLDTPRSLGNFERFDSFRAYTDYIGKKSGLYRGYMGEMLGS